MNTVGKPGQLGGAIRCVVSVSMLTEGWDANTVTHVLGIRAFGTQLLCEQVIGRALRRQSYDENEPSRQLTELAQADGKDYVQDLAAFRKQYPSAKLFAANPLKSGGDRRQQSVDFHFRGKVFPIKPGQCWKHTVVEDDGSTPGMTRLAMADRLYPQQTDVRFVRHSPIPSIREISNWWDGFGGAPNQVYVVQTNERVIERLLLMSTDPGDLVIDPTCGSGTTAAVAEQWGRRWITIDTSRVALALARARLMGARYPFYLLADSREGQIKEAEIRGGAPSSRPVSRNVRHGFVYERATNVTSGSIANNSEIEVIWDRWQGKLEPLREKLNAALKKQWREWEVPREQQKEWPDLAKKLHADWWQTRIGRQKEMDASILSKAEPVYLYHRPFRPWQRVAGGFVEIAEQREASMFQHRSAILLLSMKAGDQIVNELRDRGVLADDDEARRHLDALVLPQLEGRLVVAVEDFQRRLQASGELERIEFLALASSFLGHVFADVLPEIAEHRHFVARDVFRHRDARQLDDPALDGVHEREVAHRPREQGTLGVA